MENGFWLETDHFVVGWLSHQSGRGGGGGSTLVGGDWWPGGAGGGGGVGDVDLCGGVVGGGHQERDNVSGMVSLVVGAVSGWCFLVDVGLVRWRDKWPGRWCHH